MKTRQWTSPESVQSTQERFLAAFCSNCRKKLMQKKGILNY
ncbi:MAG: hypothetical protein V1777_03580 [Candidatus Micrarchaeota archaeon]